jgi:hypothetical protein
VPKAFVVKGDSVDIKNEICPGGVDSQRLDAGYFLPRAQPIVKPVDTRRDIDPLERTGQRTPVEQKLRVLGVIGIETDL